MVSEIESNVDRTVGSCPSPVSQPGGSLDPGLVAGRRLHGPDQ